MASKFQRDRSPYWWVKTKVGAAPGRYLRYPTRFRVGVSTDTRAANELVHTLCAQEYATAGTAKEERWEAWRPGFLALRYRRFPKSLLRYETAWRTLSMFLTEHNIETPRQLTRNHCFAYFDWRKKANISVGKYRAGHNTTLLELKFLGLLMKEAVHRGFAPANPCRELGISRDPAEKPCELDDATLLELETHLNNECDSKKAFLIPSYQIARYHGVRLSETHFDPMARVRFGDVDLPRVDLEKGSIVFVQKGGRVRQKPIHPALLPLFKALRESKARETFPMPKSFAKEWHNFFSNRTKDKEGKSIKDRLPNACFHSLRVTVENKLRRANVPKEIRMAYLSHETKDVNAGYDRFTLDELKICHAAL